MARFIDWGAVRTERCCTADLYGFVGTLAPGNKFFFSLIK